MLDKILGVLVCLFAVALSLPITLPWIVLLIAMGIWVLTKFRQVVSSRGSSPAAATNAFGFSLILGPLAIPICVFAAAVTISGAANGGFSEALKSLVSLRTFLVYFFAADIFARHPQWRAPVLACLLGAGAVSGLWGAFEQLRDWHPFSFNYLQGTGFLSGPMAFAGQMQVLGMLALALLAKSGYKHLPAPFNNKIFFIFIAAANMAGLLFAGERSAWLGALIATFMLIYFAYRGVARAYRTALLAVVVSSSIFIPVVHERMTPLVDWQHDVSIQTRLLLWGKAFKLFEDSPMFGTGINRFPHLALSDAVVPGKTTYLDHAHSNYLQILATTGIIGTVAYLYLLFASLLAALRAAEPSPESIQNKSAEAAAFDQVLGLGVLIVIVSLMVSGLFEYNFGTGQVRLAEWFVLALIPIQSLSFKGSPKS